MSLSALDLAAAGGATLVAGAINALAGGGTLVSFPTLVAIGVPALPANVTNTVALCPGYFSGTWAQREDLAPQRTTATWLAVAAAAGGLTGSALLEVTPGSTFRAAVPWLLVLSCALLISQDRVRSMVRARTTAAPSEPDAPRPARPPVPLMLAIFAGGIYGGFFGAGLGIMLLALLGLWLDESMVRINAVKQAMSLVVNTVAAVFFAISGHVRWELVPVMAVASVIGGTFGGRLSRVVNPTWLRRAVVVFGLVVAVDFWLTH
jgi:uncharacterized membrane protein YfcA